MTWILLLLAAAVPVAFLAGRRTTPSLRPRSGPDEPSDLDSELRRFEKVVETMQLGVTVTDMEGRIVYVNPADAAMHGYTPAELLGKDVRVYAPPGHASPMPSSETREMKPWQRESVNVRRDGSEFPVYLMSDLVRDSAGEPVGVVTTCEGIVERKRAERAVRESEARYALAMRGAEDGLWDWNLRTGEVFYSSHWKEMLGLEEHEIGSSPDEWLGRVHPEDLPDLQADLRTLQKGTSGRLHSEHRMLHRNGSYRWVLAKAVAECDPRDRPYRIAGALSDITERKTVETRLARNALYDSLTGLPNRSFLIDLLERAFSRMGRREEYRFGLLFMDLDGFKAVNDTLGHQAGDELLVEVGDRFKEALRPGDVVARLGGDEFCILLDELRDPSDTTRVAERIQEILREPILIDGREIRTSASIGIAVNDGSVESPEELLRFADTAMYRAKAAGKGEFEIYDMEMHERAINLLEMELEFRQALSDEDLRLVYQPVVSLEDGRITGLEALLRWVHPHRGEIPPSRFLPVAEETGMIVPVGWWVISEASRQMADWIQRYPRLSDLSMSVNISARQLGQPDLPDRIAEVLDDVGLAPANLKLEVGERALMEKPEENVRMVKRLLDQGLQVQIDDFGTGTSSLSYLNKFPVSTLKIDSSFIQTLEARAGESPALIEAVIILARSLGIRVIAEGIETAEQSEKLRSLRCEEGQGYLYSRPIEADRIPGVLKDEARRRSRV